ncbi:hypothetical protein [Larkinella rosea]|uniref:Uncharacterized protein n=1 Tax=Larkinella rosea TaxID=2025312 RepID=A0A3P1C370_9BACT|nr:hypothetical protein [Larkinella rosea]RRB07728.1 hypothetical protein EHT25_08125 [Larkinella rosea]
MNAEFNITVLGTARAGKTSLLSSIYSQLAQVIGEASGLEIKPVADADVLLDQQVSNLQSAFNSITQMPLNNADVVQPTTIPEEKVKPKPRYEFKFGIDSKKSKTTFKKSSIVDVGALLNLRQNSKRSPNRLDTHHSDIGYRFNLGQKNKKPKMQLVLRDYPGEQILDNSKEVINRIRECAVTLITIDTPALMIEGNSAFPWSFHKERNQLEKKKNGTTNIHSIFQEAYKELKDKKLVILAPVKCEKWMKEPESASLLLERIKAGYDSLLQLLASENLKDNVAVVVTPVETLGSIVYAYMDNQDVYSPQFMKRSVSSKYDPRYGDQPLRYMLRFVLKRFLEKPGFWFDWFGDDKPFLNAIHDFAKDCKSDYSQGIQTSGFSVIQGSQLL